MQASCFGVDKVGVWDPNPFHGPAAAECDGVIQTVIQSLIGPFLAKKYVDCEILRRKGEKLFRFVELIAFGRKETKCHRAFGGFVQRNCPFRNSNGEW